MKEYIEIRQSSIEGHGVFATRNFKTNEKICVFKGLRSSFKNQEKKYLKGDKRVTCDSFQVGLFSYINLDKIYNSINHSCHPNAAIKGARTLIALKTIKAGTEISFDYSATEWTPQDYTSYNQQAWPMACHCGSINCRKLITCFPYLPNEVKTKYINGGAIQSFILKKMHWPKEKQRCYICEKKLREFKSIKDNY